MNWGEIALGAVCRRWREMKSESIVFISEHGNSLPIALPLLQEGVQAQVYIHEPSYRGLYRNMMPRLSVAQLFLAVREASHVVIDMVRPNHGKPEDLELLKTFKINPKAPSIFGALGDQLRRAYPGKSITGPSVKSDRWELDREAGIELARQIGLKIPEYHAFTSFKDGAKFVYKGPGKGKKWVIKPSGNAALDLTYAETFKKGGEVLDLLTNTYPARFGTDKCDYILQAFVDDAVELSNALQIYQGKIVSVNRTFESKKFIEGDKGCNMGSASNTVWQCKDAEGIIHKQMQGLLPLVGMQNGEMDANCMVDKQGNGWFLEWTCFRLGLDAAYCQQAQIPKGKRAAFWLKGGKAKYLPGFAASQRVMLMVSGGLVREEKDRKEIRGNLINHDLKDLEDWWLQDVYLDLKGKLRVAGADGLVGVVTRVGDTMEAAINAVQKECADFECTGNLQWRTDHLEKHLERLDKLKKWGIEIF